MRRRKMANQAAFQMGWDLAGSKGKKQGKKGGDNKLAEAAGLSKDTPVFKKGGRVRKTGLALVHKGEYVVPAKAGRRKPSRKRTLIKH
jgi:hypothetical protein